MSGRELDQHVLAAADHIAAEHPHPLDERMPRIAGAVIAKDPAVRHDPGELLDALGLKGRTP